MLAGAALVPVLVAIWHDPGRSWTLTPDADLIYLGEALRGLDGRPYAYADHPGYTYTLILAAWLKLLSFLHIIPDAGLGAAISAPDIGHYMQAMTWAGRLLSAFLASGLVLAAAWLVRLGGASRLATVVFALVLALSDGVVAQTVVLRAELMSGGLAFLAFLTMALAARSSGWRAPMLLCLTGLLAMLAMEAKVQALIPLLCLPALALSLEALSGPRPPGPGDWRVEPAILGALAVCMPMAVIVPFSTRDFDFGPPIRFYDLAVMAWIAIGIAGYVRLNRVPRRVAWLGAAALAAGMALGFYLLFLRHSYRVVDAILNPIEQMRIFAGGAGRFDAPPEALLGILYGLISGMAEHSLTPLRAIEVAAVAGAAALWRWGDRRSALLSLLLLGTALAGELAFGLRGVRVNYFVYLEPWAIAAALVPLGRLLSGTRSRRAVLGLAAVLVVWQGSRALSAGVVPVQPIANVCGQADGYLEPDFAARFKPICQR